MCRKVLDLPLGLMKNNLNSVTYDAEIIHFQNKRVLQATKFLTKYLHYKDHPFN